MCSTIAIFTWRYLDLTICSLFKFMFMTADFHTFLLSVFHGTNDDLHMFFFPTGKSPVKGIYRHLFWMVNPVSKFKIKIQQSNTYRTGPNIMYKYIFNILQRRAGCQHPFHDPAPVPCNHFQPWDPSRNF